ncbi:MAG: IS1634 family transposase [Deltaproteobacteria bacterium]|jgi:transposase|nr:IS1634 family transposase [Deltaproteobacteria bacterium]
MKPIPLPPDAKLIHKQNGDTYAYFKYPYWDKEKKYSSSNKLYIGKLDDTGLLIPNLYYKNILSKNEVIRPKEYQNLMQRTNSLYNQDPIQSVDFISTNEWDQGAQAKYYGAIYLLEQIAKITGVDEDLAIAFPESYKQLLSIAYYSIITEGRPLYRYESFFKNHELPFNKNLTSPALSLLFAHAITEERKAKFVQLQIIRRQDEEYLYYDTTTISSYSECILSAKWVRNKNEEHLPQINIAMLAGEKSFLPVYYRMLPGNTADVSTLEKLIKDVEFLKVNITKFILDRGFFSAKNLYLLYEKNIDFIIAAKRNLKFLESYTKKAQQILLSNETNIDRFCDKLKVFYITEPIKWEYKFTQRTEKGITHERHHYDMYIHMYYNPIRRASEDLKFRTELNKTIEAVKNNYTLSKEQGIISKNYLYITNSVDGSPPDVKLNKDTIKQRSDDCGFFVLLSNNNESATDTLKLYRHRDLIEKSFGNLKDRLAIRRTEVHSDDALESKLFISFLSLVFISYIDKQMKNNSLYDQMTLIELIDNLDIIKICKYPGKKVHFTEVTEKQRELYRKMSVEPIA